MFHYSLKQRTAVEPHPELVNLHTPHFSEILIEISLLYMSVYQLL